VLYVFYKSPRLRTVTSYYIITLAISDVATGTLAMPAIIGVTACGCDALGSLGGKIFQWVVAELLFGSLQTTSLIAVNRYFCVVKPAVYRKHFCPKKAILMIISCWLVILVPLIAVFTSGIASIDFFASRYMRFPYINDLYTGRIITAMYQVLFTVLPATLSTICYWKIHKKIKSHKPSLASNRNTNGATSLSVTLSRSPSTTATTNREVSVVSNQLPTVVLSQISSASMESNRTMSSTIKEIKLTKSMMVIVMGFCVCWLTSSTILHISAYVHLPRLVEALFTYFGFTSSAINPILYNIYNRPFRRRAWQLLRPRNAVTEENIA